MQKRKVINFVVIFSKTEPKMSLYKLLFGKQGKFELELLQTPLLLPLQPLLLPLLLALQY